jgi:hypothetical protein
MIARGYGGKTRESHNQRVEAIYDNKILKKI